MSAFPEPPESLAEFARVAWVAYHDVTRRLAQSGGLTERGLDQVRRELRAGGIWTEQTIPAGFEAQRILLLNDVASKLAELRGHGFEDYYRGAGDLLPEVPHFVPPELQA